MIMLSSRNFLFAVRLFERPVCATVIRHKTTDVSPSLPWWNPLKRWAYERSRPVVPVIRLAGIIQSGQGRGKVNMENVAPLLQKFLKMPKRNLAALVLEINSPGGSPAQCDLIRNEIRRLVGLRGNLPVYAFVEDMGLSGGYYLAAAADQIYVNQQGLVGSIGAVHSSFGLDKLIAKWSIDRRVITAGKRKLKLDPFLPEDEHDRKMMTQLLADVQKRFIEVVRESRGNRLQESAKTELFEGDIWTSSEALRLGLVDGIGDLRGVMAERFGPHVRLLRMKKKKSLSDVLSMFGTDAPQIPGIDSMLLFQPQQSQEEVAVLLRELLKRSDGVV